MSLAALDSIIVLADFLSLPTICFLPVICCIFAAVKLRDRNKTWHLVCCVNDLMYCVNEQTSSKTSATRQIWTDWLPITPSSGSEHLSRLCLLSLFFLLCFSQLCIYQVVRCMSRIFLEYLCWVLYKAGALLDFDLLLWSFYLTPQLCSCLSTDSFQFLTGKYGVRNRKERWVWLK